MIITVRNPMLGSASFWTENLSILGFKTKTLSELVSDMFKNGEQGFFYDPSSLTYGTYGVDQTSVGVPVTVGVADAAEYDNTLHTGMVYRADQYNQSIVNFDVDNTKSHEIVIENTGSTTIAVNADLAMGTVLFTVAAGQRVTRIINPVQVIVITSANDVSTAYFKIHSLKEFTGQYTMYQESTKVTPVTNSMQPVGWIMDKSGRNNHAYQTVSASRPILQRNTTTGAYYLAFDGTDDFLVTSSINFTATDKVSVFTSVRKLSDAAPYQLVYELSAQAEINNGAFRMMSPGPTIEKGIVFGSRGTLQTSVNIPNYPAPINLLTTVRSSIGTPLLNARVNGIQVSNIATSQGTGNYGNYPLYIGRRNGTHFPFNGNLYSLIGIGRLTTDAETIALEKSIAKNTGVTLSV